MKRYEKYKPSGIEWIGEVPEQWGLVKTKFVCTLNTGNSLNAQQKAFYGEITEDVPSRPYIASKDIDRDTEFIDYDNGIRIPLDELSFEVAPANSTLLCIEGGSAGKKMGFVDREVCYVNKLCCFNSFKINPKYQYYFVKSRPYWEVFSQNIQGMIGGVSVGVLKEIKMPLPSPAEQEAIAAYLDARCGDIDKVVTTQEKRIALLNEMKQSIITQAVTRGLNPDAKLNDSGVEWIGMVPEHWEVCRLKNTLKENLMYGANESAECDNPDFPRYIRITDLTDDGKLRDETFKSLEPEKAKPYMLKQGDLLFARSGATVGKTFLFDLDIEACFAGYLIKASFNRTALPKYVFYYTQSGIYENWKNSIFIQATIQNIGAEKYANLPFIRPGIDEQKDIVEYLEGRCGEIDKQIEAVTRQIELLTEYKQALITEVVTGKRKVC